MAVTPVVRNSVSGQQTTHHRGDGNPTRPQQQMKMIGDKHPGKTDSTGVVNYSTKTIQEIVAVCIISKNLTTLNTTSDNVMHRTRRVYPRLPRYHNTIAQ